MVWDVRNNVYRKDARSEEARLEGVPEASYCHRPSIMKVGNFCAYGNVKGEPYVVREAVMLRISQKIDDERADSTTRECREFEERKGGMRNKRISS